MEAAFKILEEADIPFMREALEDDHMVFDPARLAAFIRGGGNVGFIAKWGEKIAGFAYAYSLLRPDGKRMLFLFSFGLLSEYQNRGIGSAFMGYIAEYGRREGCSECFVITDKGNPRACRVYEKAGGKSEYEDEVVYVIEYEKQPK